MKNDLISRQAAIDIVRFECGEWRGLAKTIENGLNDLPSAQSEIIHCRECKYKMLDISGDEWICSHPSNNAWRITANHYCGYAERREE